MFISEGEQSSLPLDGKDTNTYALVLWQQDSHWLTGSLASLPIEDIILSWYPTEPGQLYTAQCKSALPQAHTMYFLPPIQAFSLEAAVWDSGGPCSVLRHVQHRSVAELMPCGANFQPMGDKKIMWNTSLCLSLDMVLGCISYGLLMILKDQPTSKPWWWQLNNASLPWLSLFPCFPSLSFTSALWHHVPRESTHIHNPICHALLSGKPRLGHWHLWTR